MPFDGIVTRAVTQELTTKLIPGKIAKIYQPTATELVFKIRHQGKNQQLLLSIHPTYARLHLTDDEYNNPQEPPMFCMLLRKHLNGATLEAIEQDGMERIIQFTFKTRNDLGDITYKRLILELMGKHSNAMLVDPVQGHIMDSLKHVPSAVNRHRTILPGQAYKRPPQQDKYNILETTAEDFMKKLDFNAGLLDKQIRNTLTGFSTLIAHEFAYRCHMRHMDRYKELFKFIQTQIIENDYTPAIYQQNKEDFHVLPITMYAKRQETYPTTNQMLDAFFSGKAERDRIKQQARDLYRLIKNEKDKNLRKQKKQMKTLKTAEGAERYQHLGELLTAHMHHVQQGDKAVTVTDYYDPNQSELTIDLNPNKSPSENAQSFFKTYQKLKTSKQRMEQELDKTEREIIYLDGLMQQIDTAREADVEEIREELRDEGYLKKQRQTKKSKKRAKPSPEEYESTAGITILVGKNNKQNDYLTMKMAHRYDTWLHTKNIPGSHVIIKDSDPDEATIDEACQIAAFFSKSSQSSSVPVDYTNVRHVHKPNGAKPGFVTYDQQKTRFVTPNREIIEALRKKNKN